MLNCFSLPPDLRQHLCFEGWLLHERLAAAPKHSAAANSQEALDAWNAALSPGRPGGLDVRLAGTGHDRAQAAWAVEPPVDAVPADPSWLVLLAEISDTTRQLAERLEDTTFLASQAYPLIADAPRPFETLWLPALEVARHHLAARQTSSSQLAPSAKADLESALLQRLCEIATPVLLELFDRERPLGHRLLARALPVQPSGETARYRAFISHHATTGLHDLLWEFPVLGRLLATVVMHWVESSAEFLQRLHQDWPTVREYFGVQSTAVVAIQTRLSDAHRGGRTTAILRFDQGERLVYKPKSLEIDQAYQNFLIWCNHHLDVPRPFRALTILQGMDYGWVEYVEHRPLEHPEQWRIFYEQAGALLAILYLLGATDCHLENLIASDEQLVLIDTETLLYSPVPSTDEQVYAIHSAIQRRFQDSVARVGLLPTWTYVGQKVAVDMSALGSSPQSSSLAGVKVLKQINTDDMALQLGESPIRIHTNLPYRATDDVEPADYLDDLITGFMRTYQQLMRHRSLLLAPSSPLEAFQHRIQRHVFRSTQIYATLLQQALQPTALKHANAFSLALEPLYRAGLPQGLECSYWPVLAIEQTELAQLDIPFFDYWNDKRALLLSNGTHIQDYFESDGYSALLERVTNLSEVDLSFQQLVIRGSFCLRGNRRSTTDCCACDDALSTHDGIRKNISELDYAALAVGIAEEIFEHAWQDPQGEHQWLGFSQLPGTDGKLRFAPMGLGFYDGQFGLAFFLAALDHCRGTDTYRTHLLQLLERLQETIITVPLPQRWRLARSLGLGFGGLGGILYALAWFQIWGITSEKRSPVMIAKHLIAMIDHQLIERDEGLDLQIGSAGLIPACLIWHTMTGDTAWLNLARYAGQHLLNHQDQATGGWNTLIPAPRPLTGMAHGTAGMALALLRLQAHTGESQWREGAARAIAYESSVFNSDQHNWPDYRYSAERPSFPNQWCFGGAGIGLARLQGLGIDAELDQQFQIDLDQVSLSLMSGAINAVDHLCCGNLGRVETLLVIGQRLGREDLMRVAYSMVEHVVERAQCEGGYGLIQMGNRLVYDPGFFQGMAGIGYQFLRLSNPNKLPSVLSLEIPLGLSQPSSSAKGN